MVSTTLIAHLILTTVLSLLALISTALVIYRLYAYERARLNDAETRAFRLLDEVLRSLLPRNLSKRLNELYKTEVAAVTNVNKAALIYPNGPTGGSEHEPAYENVKPSIENESSDKKAPNK